VQPGETCRHSDGPALGGYTEYSPPLRSTETYVGLGVVRAPYVWTGPGAGVSAMVAARLFDVAPDGTELLMTRGVYRFENEPVAGELRLPLYGNHWRLEPGHRIRLDLTQADVPTYRPSNFQSEFAFPSGVTLVLPTR
jgi:predicted acyl esterase